MPADARTIAETADRVRALVARIVAGIGLDGEVTVAIDDDTITATVSGDGVGLLIGHHGQTIDAIQHLASRVALGDGSGPRHRVVVDADGYRARRLQALVGICATAVTSRRTVKARSPIGTSSSPRSERFTFYASAQRVLRTRFDGACARRGR